jgi:hypothetical protein
MHHEITPYAVILYAAALIMSWRFSRGFTLFISLSAALMQWGDPCYLGSILFFSTLLIVNFTMPGGNSKDHLRDYPRGWGAWGWYY